MTYSTFSTFTLLAGQMICKKILHRQSPQRFSQRSVGDTAQCEMISAKKSPSPF